MISRCFSRAADVGATFFFGRGVFRLDDQLGQEPDAYQQEADDEEANRKEEERPPLGAGHQIEPGEVADEGAPERIDQDARAAEEQQGLAREGQQEAQR